MFIPLHDNTPLRLIRVQYLTLLIIALNVVVFLVTGALEDEERLFVISAGFGVVPAEMTGALRDGALNPVPDPVTLVTYQFLHAGWWHLITNLAFLWVFADNVEDAFGHFIFPLLYLATGAVGGAVHVLMQPDSQAPLIGASGAVAGVLGAYLVLYPRARVWVLLFLRVPWRFSAWMVLGAWIAFQIAGLAWRGEAAAAIGWWAHIGGFAAGLAFAWPFRRMLGARLDAAP